MQQCKQNHLCVLECLENQLVLTTQTDDFVQEYSPLRYEHVSRSEEAFRAYTGIKNILRRSSTRQKNLANLSLDFGKQASSILKGFHSYSKNVYVVKTRNR